MHVDKKKEEKILMYLIMVPEMIDFDMLFKICVVKNFLNSTFICPNKVPVCLTRT